MPAPINLNVTRIILTNSGATQKRSFSDLIGGQGTVASIEDFTPGGADDTVQVQNAITAMPPGGTILGYPGKQYVISSTINMVSKYHPKLIGNAYGDCFNPGATGADSPHFLWNGATNGTMFNISSCFNPVISGFNFTSNFAINNYIVFDNTGLGGVTGTAGVTRDCSFVNPTKNIAFVAVNISPTSTTNVENYIVERCNFQGFGGASFSGKDIVSNGTKTITSASNPWVSGQVGQRVRVSWSDPLASGSDNFGLIDDTIATFNSAGSIVLTTNNVPTNTNLTVHVDQGYGIGILVGNSQNSKHHKFRENSSVVMQYGVVVVGGSFSVSHWNGENDDFGVCYGYTLGGANNMPTGVSSHITEPCLVDFLESEGDIVGVYGTGGGTPLMISNARIDNTKQSGLGFFQLADATFLNCGPITVTPSPMQVVVGRIGGFGAGGTVISRGNIWGTTKAALGLKKWNIYPHSKSQWNSNDQFSDGSQVPIIGAALDFGALPSDPQPGQLAIIIDANSGTPGNPVTAGGGAFVSLVMYAFSTARWIVVANVT